MGGTKSNAPKARKRVEATEEPVPADGPFLMRAKDGSAFTRCGECNKSVPVALISMHSCSLDAKIKMNLGAQVVEAQNEVKKKPTQSKKPKSDEPKSKRSKTERKTKSKNPNAPKRPPTAFFLFMDDFRKEFKEKNPDSKGVQDVAKGGGERWKSMTDEAKKVYQDKAAELKAEYGKALESSREKDENQDGGSDKEVAEKEVEEISDGEE